MVRIEAFQAFDPGNAFEGWAFGYSNPGRCIVSPHISWLYLSKKAFVFRPEKPYVINIFSIGSFIDIQPARITEMERVKRITVA